MSWRGLWRQWLADGSGQQASNTPLASDTALASAKLILGPKPKQGSSPEPRSGAGCEGSLIQEPPGESPRGPRRSPGLVTGATFAGFGWKCHGFAKLSKAGGTKLLALTLKLPARARMRLGLHLRTRPGVVRPD